MFWQNCLVPREEFVWFSGNVYMNSVFSLFYMNAEKFYIIDKEGTEKQNAAKN